MSHKCDFACNHDPIEPASQAADTTAAPGEVERMVQRLKEMDATHFSFTRGSNPSATPDQVAVAVNSALDKLESRRAPLPAAPAPTKTMMKVDPLALTALAVSGALPVAQAGEILRDIYAPVAALPAEQAGELPPLPKGERAACWAKDMIVYTKFEMIQFRAEGIAAALTHRQAPAEAAGQWVRCTPNLINAGVDCGKTPRRAGDGTYSHDHFIAHGAARQVGAPDVEMDARDAARYRWLRSVESDVCIMLPDPPDDQWIPHTENLDKAIDAAIAQEKAS